MSIRIRRIWCGWCIVWIVFKLWLRLPFCKPFCYVLFYSWIACVCHCIHGDITSACIDDSYLFYDTSWNICITHRKRCSFSRRRGSFSWCNQSTKNEIRFLISKRRQNSKSVIKSFDCAGGYIGGKSKQIGLNVSKSCQNGKGNAFSSFDISNLDFRGLSTLVKQKAKRRGKAIVMLIPIFICLSWSLHLPTNILQLFWFSIQVLLPKVQMKKKWPWGKTTFTCDAVTWGSRLIKRILWSFFLQVSSRSIALKTEQTSSTLQTSKVYDVSVPLFNAKSALIIM